MPGMCTMCLFVFPRWNSKTIPVPWAKRKNGKRYSDSNGQAALMHWFQLWSPQNLSQWENDTDTLQLIWKEDRGDPEYSMCNVCPKSSYLPLIHFVIQCIQSSLSSCDICRHNPALINSLCSCSVFCHTQEKIIKNSRKHRLPPQHCLLSDFCHSLYLHPCWVQGRFRSYCTSLWTAQPIWEL